MLLSNLLLVMAATGILGGLVNFYSDANKKTVGETVTIIRSWPVCILLGFAATLMVPFFLKLADSKLLDSIYITKTSMEKDSTVTGKTAPYPLVVTKDSAGKTTKTDTAKGKNNDVSKQAASDTASSPARDYLLWTAYCLLAAAAGMRFINMLIDKVMSQAEKDKLVEDNQKLKEKDIKNTKGNTKSVANALITQSKEFKKEIGVHALKAAVSLAFNPDSLPPVTNPYDLQKGRFGGQSKRNGRTLLVSYTSYPLPNFLNLTFTVKVDEGTAPLNGEVYLFLHDSFAKSVVKLEALNEMEVSYTIPSYGAFTIGAVTDNGNTLLELDLAEVTSLPEDFRKR